MDYRDTAGWKLVEHYDNLTEIIRQTGRRGRRSDAADREQRDRLAASDWRPGVGSREGA